MSSSSPARNHGRRASDRLQRQKRLRWAVTGSLAGIAVVVLLGAYWWYRQREPARDGAPGWTPDGQAIVFSAEVGSGKGDIYIMRADGSDREDLTNSPNAADGSPAVSPDGQHIAFESDRDGNPEIYVMDRRGGDVRRLTNDPGSDQSPAWSPDGRHLAFTSDRGGRGPDLYVMNADGTGAERLTTGAAVWAPQYAPDGRQIAFQSDHDVQVFDRASGALRRITSSPDNGMNPAWSPDGTRLAFVTTRNRRAELFTANANGTAAGLLVSLPDGNAIDPRWSPDGSKIAFVVVPDAANPADPKTVQAIYTVDVVSGVLTRLSR